MEEPPETGPACPADVVADIENTGNNPVPQVDLFQLCFSAVELGSNAGTGVLMIIVDTYFPNDISLPPISIPSFDEANACAVLLGCTDYQGVSVE